MWDRIRLENVALALARQHNCRNAIVYVDGVQAIVQGGRVLSDMEADKLEIKGRDVGVYWPVFYLDSKDKHDDIGDGYDK